MGALLFIDDEKGVRRSIVRALKNEPYQVYTAENGRTGIAMLKKRLEVIHTVISDYKMPGLNGLETLRTVGRLNPEVTRVILTGYATMEAAIQATNQGIDGFLTKPFDNRDLRQKISDIALKKRLKQFVSEAVYNEIKKSRGALRPRYHEVSILFSDIRGFTAMSQGITPGALADFLNHHFFSPMGEIAYQYHGTVDKHIGDGMMVVFGTPVAYKNDALLAVAAAVAMQRKAREIDRRLAAENGFRLRVGIGVSTGKVFSGVLGSLRKKEFTAIGMPVNVAARLQRLAGAGEILVAEKTFHKIAARIKTKCLGPVSVKGLRAPIPVYRVMGAVPPRR